MNYTSDKDKFDEIVEKEGKSIIINFFIDVKLIIDNKALMYLLGTKMDYIEDELKSEFVFINPNSKGSCGCGESFNV
jgi:iron-sulfur cluster assembly accessory protein